MIYHTATNNERYQLELHDDGTIHYGCHDDYTLVEHSEEAIQNREGIRTQLYGENYVPMEGQ